MMKMVEEGAMILNEGIVNNLPAPPQAILLGRSSM